MRSANEYIPTIGLEVHAQLLTKSKMFAPEATSYGKAPNAQVSAITLAHPGTMPMLNRKAIDSALKMGLACHTSITRYNEFARKNYFYPDLAKGYQITQDKTPLCTDGYVTIDTPLEKKIRIKRIHIEEDTAKSMHDMMPGYTLLDFNRAGCPLIEIVTEPDVSTQEEAYAFLAEIRRLVRYLEICNGNMEEGSLRCDANISVRKKGTEQLGQKVEVKNMNSMRHVQMAIAYEIKRQIKILEEGGKILSSTRSYHAEAGITVHQRNKETMSEYRYFPEPDLSPLIVDKGWIQTIQENMPPLPRVLAKKFTTLYKLSTYDTNVLLEDKSIALFFEQTCPHTTHYKAVANWMMGPIKSYLNQEKTTLALLPITPIRLAKLVDMVATDQISFSVASAKLFPLLFKHPTTDIYQIAQQEGLLQKESSEELEAWIHTVLNKYPDKVEAYRKGKKGLIGFFMGEVMKLSKGQANPKQASLLLQKIL
ncbi:MAG: Asp-tRNA(Asn)/Glu-tRNA(Gln) amidotransferase subunit GatB [Bacteroidota bacterium]